MTVMGRVACSVVEQVMVCWLAQGIDWVIRVRGMLVSATKKACNKLTVRVGYMRLCMQVRSIQILIEKATVIFNRWATLLSFAQCLSWIKKNVLWRGPMVQVTQSQRAGYQTRLREGTQWWHEKQWHIYKTSFLHSSVYSVWYGWPTYIVAIRASHVRQMNHLTWFYIWSPPVIRLIKDMNQPQATVTGNNDFL